ncbi:MAG: glycosyltransferase family 4 protein [Acidimicrobiales bacterium]
MLGAASPPAGSSAESLRVALLTYRGNPLCGGQGVYVHYLSRELAELGHRVKVVSGPPYPYVVPGVELVKLPSLDLYRASDPFRTPRLAELGNVVDLAEWALMCTGRFPEPLTYSLRAWRWLRPRRDELDVVHDNQCLGYGILGIARELPVVATIHHPITVDRDLELAQAPDRRRQASLRRWYGFVAMQTRVVRRLSHIITVSKSSGRDICAQMGARPEQLSVVPVGVDPDLFRPIPYIARVPGRIMTTASADVALKGLLPLLEALAKVRTERHAELVVVGQPRADGAVPTAIERLGLQGAVTVAGVVGTEEMVRLYASAEVAVVPSLYEGFSLPAIEAMACGLPLVTTTGGALPEVVGADGHAALLVPPGDPGALAAAIGRALDDADIRQRLGAAGRERALRKYTWRSTAEATADRYRQAILDRPLRASWGDGHPGRGKVGGDRC